MTYSFGLFLLDLSLHSTCPQRRNALGLYAKQFLHLASLLFAAVRGVAVSLFFTLSHPARGGHLCERRKGKKKKKKKKPVEATW
jgi:hypothetical protein